MTATARALATSTATAPRQQKKARGRPFGFPTHDKFGRRYVWVGVCIFLREGLSRVKHLMHYKYASPNRETLQVKYLVARVAVLRARQSPVRRPVQTCGCLCSP